MNYRKTFAFVACGVILVLLSLVIMLMIGGATELNQMRQGVQHGFELSGTYVKPLQDGSFVSFENARTDETDTQSWQAQDGQGVGITGLVEKTADPNFYLLMNDEGTEVGWVHLAYSNAKGEGTLFIRYGSRDLEELTKFSRIPLTTAYPE